MFKNMVSSKMQKQMEKKFVFLKSSHPELVDDGLLGILPNGARADWEPGLGRFEFGVQLD
jgi:hypothetical protein